MRIFQCKLLAYFIVLIIYAPFCFSVMKPQINNRFMPKVTIVNAPSVQLYNSLILEDCKIISGKIIFLSSPKKEKSILTNGELNLLLHLTILNFNEILSVKIHSYLILKSKITWAVIEFANSKIIDSTELSLLIGYCKNKKVHLNVGIINQHFLEWHFLMIMI